MPIDDKKLAAYISPNYPDTKLENPTFDDLLDVFKDRTINWLIEPAKSLLRDRNGYFAAISILMTYYESIWSYITGINNRGKSKIFFTSSFIDVNRISGINEEFLGRLADLLWEDCRCGFFHEAAVRDRIYVARTFENDKEKDMLITLPRKKDGKFDFDAAIESVVINPHRIAAAIESHFVSYLLTLRNEKNESARNKFYKIAKEQWDWEVDGRVVAIRFGNNYTFR
jgi:hypothetical protein